MDKVPSFVAGKSVQVCDTFWLGKKQQSVSLSIVIHVSGIGVFCLLGNGSCQIWLITNQPDLSADERNRSIFLHSLVTSICSVYLFW